MKTADLPELNEDSIEDAFNLLKQLCSSVKEPWRQEYRFFKECIEPNITCFEKERLKMVFRNEKS